MPKPRKTTVAVYPGSFDPVTHGHLDIIRRAADIFNELVVGIGRNPDKSELFTPAERLELLLPHLKYPNVRAETYEGLTMDFVHRMGGNVLVRGIRDAADLGGELQQANVNMMIANIDTVFLLTNDQHVLTSSTYVKQLYEMGGGVDRLKRLVPDNVAERLMRMLPRGGGGGAPR